MAFQLFSIEHVLALIALPLGCIAICLFRTQLRRPQVNRYFRYSLAAVLLACEIALQLSYVWTDAWNLGSLPFQLCSLTLLLSAIALIWQWSRLYPIIFFLGSLGALQALFTPNLDQAFPHFRFFHFFIAHIGIMATAVFIVAVAKYRPTLRMMVHALLWLHVLAIPAFIVNSLTGWTNFMFLARKPATASLLDLLAPWPWYLLQLELVAIGMSVLLLGLLKGILFINRRMTQ